jgi:hypothetical protein
MDQIPTVILFKMEIFIYDNIGTKNTFILQGIELMKIYE